MREVRSQGSVFEVIDIGGRHDEETDADAHYIECLIKQRYSLSLCNYLISKQRRIIALHHFHKFEEKEERSKRSKTYLNFNSTAKTGGGDLTSPI